MTIININLIIVFFIILLIIIVVVLIIEIVEGRRVEREQVVRALHDKACCLRQVFRGSLASSLLAACSSSCYFSLLSHSSVVPNGATKQLPLPMCDSPAASIAVSIHVITTCTICMDDSELMVGNSVLHVHSKCQDSYNHSTAFT